MARYASHATLLTALSFLLTHGPMGPTLARVDPTPDRVDPTLARVVPTPGTLTHDHQPYGLWTFPGPPGGYTMTSLL